MRRLLEKKAGVQAKPPCPSNLLSWELRGEAAGGNAGIQHILHIRRSPRTALLSLVGTSWLYLQESHLLAPPR